MLSQTAGRQPAEAAIRIVGARGIYQDVDFAESLAGECRNALDIFGARNIGPTAEDVVARFGQLGFQGTQPVCTAGRRRHPYPFGGEQPDDRASDSARRSQHERTLILQGYLHRNRLS